LGADQPDPTGELPHYLKAKHVADEHLMVSMLTNAILRPVTLTNEGRGAEVIVSENVDKPATALRADVAHFLVEAAITGRFDDTAQGIQSV